MARDYIQKIKLSKEEHELLLERANNSNMSVAAYMRMMSKKTNMSDDIRDDIRKLVNETNRIGNNINQITKKVNSGVYTDDDKNRLMAYMQALNKKVKAVGDRYGD